MKNWQTEIGNLVKETYQREGYSDVLIMIGGISKEDDIHTQIWYPGETYNDFDIRFMVFALFNHLFSEYNDIESNSKDDEN